MKTVTNARHIAGATINAVRVRRTLIKFFGKQKLTAILTDQRKLEILMYWMSQADSGAMTVHSALVCADIHIMQEDMT